MLCTYLFAKGVSWYWMHITCGAKHILAINCSFFLILIWMNLIEQEIGWPTPNGITLEQATEYCQNFVIQSTSGSLCKNVNNVQLDTSLENCVEDIQVRASRWCQVLSSNIHGNMYKSGIFAVSWHCLTLLDDFFSADWWERLGNWDATEREPAVSDWDCLQHHHLGDHRGRAGPPRGPVWSYLSSWLQWKREMQWWLTFWSIVVTHLNFLFIFPWT